VGIGCSRAVDVNGVERMIEMGQRRDGRRDIGGDEGSMGIEGVMRGVGVGACGRGDLNGGRTRGGSVCGGGTAGGIVAVLGGRGGGLGIGDDLCGARVEAIASLVDCTIASEMVVI